MIWPQQFSDIFILKARKIGIKKSLKSNKSFAVCF